jgi:protein-tyrosine phosphatase
MAEALLAAALPSVGVASAGTGALVGRGADPLAVELIAGRGLSLAQHVARNVDPQMIQRADLILAMTREQREYIANVFAFSRGRVYRLLEQDDEDVVDPYRQGKAAFAAALEQIERGVLAWQARIDRLNASGRTPR